MKKYEAIYTPLIETFEYLSNSDETDIFVNSLDEKEESAFSDLREEFEGFSINLQNILTKKEVYSEFKTVYETTEKFSILFPDFPNLKKEKLLLEIHLRRKIAEAMIVEGEYIFDEDDINQDDFIVNELTDNIKQDFFQNYNQNDPSNCGVFFSLKNYDSLIKAIDIAELNLGFWIQLIPAIRKAEILLDRQYSITKQSTPPLETSLISNFIKLLIVAKGENFHEVYNYTARPLMVNYEKISVNVDYTQQHETIYILNEYNCRHELLTKYLTAYQIIENFMYKTIIVNLEQNLGGRFFSIRDFANLYKRVSENEIAVITDFFKGIFRENIQAGATFQIYWLGKWNQLTADIPQNEIDNILVMLGLKTTFITVNSAGTFATSIAHIVYKMRNSIVHNKETEFHLTNLSLTNETKLFIDLYLLPLLESLVFMLICEKNTHVWYANQQIKLY